MLYFRSFGLDGAPGLTNTKEDSFYMNCRYTRMVSFVMLANDKAQKTGHTEQFKTLYGGLKCWQVYKVRFYTNLAEKNSGDY